MNPTINPDARTLSRAAPEDIALDYTKLLAEGIALVQQLSGDVWTNFNYSDPGVTILEQLCYALTELAYRAGFAVEDLLGAPDSGEVLLDQHGLYPAPAIMPVNPVTPDDWRRLVIDRVPAVANIWFTPLPAATGAGNSGLYRIDVLARATPCDCAPFDNDDRLLTSVLDCYSAHRGLAEDVDACRVLVPLPAHVGADVYLDADSDPETVMARLLFVLGMALAPEPRRSALQPLLDAGLSSADIFRGPLMLHGFIADSELTPRVTAVVVNDLLAAMLDVDGVLMVESLALLVGEPAQTYRGGQECPVPDGYILQLQPVWRAGQGALRLLRDGVVCTPSGVKVRRLLERAWAEQRRTYPLGQQYRDAYPAPVGRALPLAAYTSVQNQFPRVYGIGSDGLPGEAGVARKAQARQLKGYLMAADQLMANYCSQLAFVRQLFSIEAGGKHTYAWQSLREIVADSAPLLHADYEQRLAALVGSHDPVAARQSAVLDFLLSLYAASLDAPAGVRGLPASRQAAVLQAKRTLLTRMVPATHDRGRGFDYRRGGHHHDGAGLEIRCQVELALAGLEDGVDEAAENPASGLSPRLVIVEWILLRYAAEHDEQPPPPMADAFRCRISVVLPAPQRDDDAANAAWRDQVYAIVRANTPAHLVIDACFLDHHQLRHFHRLHEEWRRALRAGTAAQRRRTSRDLAHFLQPATLAAALAPQPVDDDAEIPLLLTLASSPPAAGAGQQPPPAAASSQLPDRAPAGVSGANLHHKLSDGAAAHYAAKGFAFVIRDVGHPHTAIADLLDATEVREILAAKLALMLRQSLSPVGPPLDAESGTRCARHAVEQAQSAGVPEGVTIWLDLREAPENTAPDDLLAFCQAWHASVEIAGYLPGLRPLSFADAGFYARLSFSLVYWRAASVCARLPARGACLITAAGSNYALAGIRYDWTYVQADELGLTPAWLQPRSLTPEGHHHADPR